MLQKIKCLLYTCLDAFKQTRLASWAFYYGHSFRHYEEISRTGRVFSVEAPGADGDRCFDIVCEHDSLWHCEVTVCAPEGLRALAATIKVVDTVQVVGTSTWDPDHHILWWKFKGGHNEIHPVTKIAILSRG